VATTEQCAVLKGEEAKVGEAQKAGGKEKRNRRWWW